jgi:hypothetical protein
MKNLFCVPMVVMIVTITALSGYASELPQEITARGIVPKEWGTLKFVEPFKPGDQYHKRLYFEDSEGTVRMVGLFLYRNGFKVGDKVTVIKRIP